MHIQNVLIRPLLIANLCLHTIIGFCQEVENVPKAFKALSQEPEIIIINNPIKVPVDAGHLQGVQAVDIYELKKLLISGSSLSKAYVLQIDLTTRKAEKLIPLMNEPYRHAGGIQVSEPFLIVGIEDNFAKTTSKVCLYNYRDVNLYQAYPNQIIDRKGEAKYQTAGATGLLNMNEYYLAVVGNWDSRKWDFYRLNPEEGEQKILNSFVVPDDWPSYQSINLIKDKEAIYAVGFYSKDAANYADLIIISGLDPFELIMEIIFTKNFHCKKGVDFSTAAGLQVDKKRHLHIWGTQRDALKRIAVNQFSQH